MVGMARAPVTRGTATSGGAVGGGTGASETQVGMWLSTPSEIGRMGQSLRFFIFMTQHAMCASPTPPFYSLCCPSYLCRIKRKKHRRARPWVGNRAQARVVCTPHETHSFACRTSLAPPPILSLACGHEASPHGEHRGERNRPHPHHRVTLCTLYLISWMRERWRGGHDPHECPDTEGTNAHPSPSPPPPLSSSPRSGTLRGRSRPASWRSWSSCWCW